jgi:DNA-binding XRE family transcriptional regulator
MLLTDRHQKLATDAPRWWRTFQFPLAPWGWQSANLCDNRGTMPKYRHYLREWRQKRGLTQEQVAEAMGTHRGMISRYESSQRGLTLEVQFRLMEVLDIMPAQFFPRLTSLRSTPCSGTPRPMIASSPTTLSKCFCGNTGNTKPQTDRARASLAQTS